jgi:aminoglycoside 3-N-acetyltransferase
VTKPDIVAGLRQLGIRPGMGMVVHSSLSSFGHVQGGAHTVVSALMECLGGEGTLLMPTFNHGLILEPGGMGYYSVAETPTRNGAIPELFRTMRGVHRSLHPTHAFAAWGSNAERYVAQHHRTFTMGEGSPLAQLLADDGYCLLLGVSYRSNTFHHVVETAMGATCLGPRTEAYPVVLSDGREVTGRSWGWRERDCRLTGGNAYADEMERRGLHREVRIGSCRALLYRLRDCFEVVSGFLREGRDDIPPCSRCPIRPRKVAHTVESDWDLESGRLRPDSESLTY